MLCCNRRAALLDEVCNDDAILRLLHDQFGNYVIQRALTVSSIDMGTKLVGAIRPHLPALANSSGGRRITAVSHCYLCLRSLCCLWLLACLAFIPLPLPVEYACHGCTTCTHFLLETLCVFFMWTAHFEAVPRSVVVRWPKLHELPGHDRPRR